MFFRVILAFAWTAFMGHLLALMNKTQPDRLTVMTITTNCDRGHIAARGHLLRFKLLIEFSFGSAQKFVGEGSCILIKTILYTF